MKLVSGKDWGLVSSRKVTGESASDEVPQVLGARLGPGATHGGSSPSYPALLDSQAGREEL